MMMIMSGKERKAAGNCDNDGYVLGQPTLSKMTRISNHFLKVN